MNAESAYSELVQRSRESATLESCADLLSWEEQTYMPPGGIEHRSKQLALLAGMAHEKRTDPRVGELLGTVEGSELVRDPLSVQAVNVRELRRRFDRSTRLPKRLVEELAQTASLAQRAWINARKDSNYKSFQPWLDKTLLLKREQADAFGYKESRYDALLDDFEPAATARELTALFASLRAELVPLVERIASAPRKPNEAILERSYPVDRQRIFGESAAAAIGFDFQAGRLDVTAHPFCSGIGPGDCRITTRYDEHQFNESFFGVLHESGHGMYEQGLPAEHFGTPMGQTVSLGIHESQSRLWENAVGRSGGFWRHFFPRAQQMFPASLHDVALDDFLFAVNVVKPSLIRVEADEITYNLHILIRFELEQAMLADELPTADLPAAWTERYQNYLGVSPPDHATGCLQDIHWSAGLWAYFPTYTLGNLYAAQLVKAAATDLGDLDALFARGDFAPLLDWLRRKIHQQGQRYRPADLVEFATGNRPSHRPLLETLRAKFVPLYGL